EREVAEADDDVAERVTQHPGGDRGGEKAGQGFSQVVLGEEPGAVRAEAEERGVAERYDPGVAEDQVERQREQRRDRDLAREREIARRDGERQQRAKPEGDLERVPAHLRPEMLASAFQTAPRAAT